MYDIIPGQPGLYRNIDWLTFHFMRFYLDSVRLTLMTVEIIKDYWVCITGDLIEVMSDKKAKEAPQPKFRASDIIFRDSHRTISFYLLAGTTVNMLRWLIKRLLIYHTSIIFVLGALIRILRSMNHIVPGPMMENYQNFETLKMWSGEIYRAICVEQGW